VSTGAFETVKLLTVNCPYVGQSWLSSIRKGPLTLGAVRSGADTACPL